MGKTIVKYLGHNEGHMISKLEENLGDTDIKNFTVSPLYQIKCICFSLSLLYFFFLDNYTQFRLLSSISGSFGTDLANQ